MGFEPVGRGRAAHALVVIALAAAVLVLDGQIGPLSVAIRRAAALIVVATIAASGVARGRGWRPARWAAIVVAAAIVARAPSVSAGLVGFIVALAAIEVTLKSRSTGAPLAAGLVPASYCYVALRFAVDLVPQAGAISQTASRAASRYVSLARALDADLSFNALGGPAVVLAVLYLLWTWRRAGGIGRLVAAVTIPLAWFAALAVVTPDASTGSLTAFWRGSLHGLFWMGIAALVAAVLPGRQPHAEGPRREDLGTEPPRTGRTSLARRFVGAVSARRPAASGSVVMHHAPLAAACLAAALAAVCLVGTGLIGPAKARSIRVHNYGGLDWDRPVFGRFGAFSSGMFGLLPVYCRAEGYDFDVIDAPQRSGSGERQPPPRGFQGEAAPRTPTPARAEPATNRNSTIAASAETPATKSNGDQASPPRTRSDAASPARVASPASAVSRVVDTIKPADLEKTQILILINSPKVWDSGQRQVVLDFVARGGSLLVLGDHTDVFGLMRGFNSLLGPLGIRFRFDSAYRARETWRGCQSAAPDAVAWGWDDENPGVAVGASLELSGSARPLLLGRYAFSDAGVRENSIGSFLGNYHYDRGERLGDVVLVATSTYGRGRIVVWGDTSAFQGGLSSSYAKVVGLLFVWLSRPAAWTERPPVRITAAVGLLATILWLWLVRGTALHVAALAVSLMLGLAVPWLASWPNLNAQARVADDAFLIDRSHFPASGHYEALVNPTGSLYTCLLRCGFRVIDMEKWDRGAIARARGIALVAPQRSFNPAEVRELVNAEENGAVVILAAGEPDSAGSRRLLEAHGLALAPRPMGTVWLADPLATRPDREREPRFLDAWPIVRAKDDGSPAEVPGVEIIDHRGEDVTAVFCRRGRGGLLLISDTRFFSDMNVEGVSGYWLGNLALIHDMFRRYLGADPDAVQPLFRSPEKPR